MKKVFYVILNEDEDLVDFEYKQHFFYKTKKLAKEHICSWNNSQKLYGPKVEKYKLLKLNVELV